MTFYVETEVDIKALLFPDQNEESHRLPEEIEAFAGQVMTAVLEAENCPYEAQINLLLTDNKGIQAYNRDMRNIDAPTDVLSFPNLTFLNEGDFSAAEEDVFSCFDPDSGELLLGDIVLSVEKVRSQAIDYGHSIQREFGFLLAHSMFHLCGYDHEEEAEAGRMEEKQEQILKRLGVDRFSE